MILLVHHGDAVGPAIDPMRPLSADGRAAVERLADGVAARGVRPDEVWHSGKLRARQTAELFWRACNPLASLSAVPGLQPGDSPRRLHERLVEETRSIVIVGHMPNLPRLLGALGAGTPDAAAADFPPHGCVALERRDGDWQERWRLP